MTGRHHFLVFLLTALGLLALFALLWLVRHLVGVGLDPGLASVCVGIAGFLSWTDWRQARARRARSRVGSRRRTP